jgi:hypothetical protein
MTHDAQAKWEHGERADNDRTGDTVQAPPIGHCTNTSTWFESAFLYKARACARFRFQMEASNNIEFALESS